MRLKTKDAPEVVPYLEEATEWCVKLLAQNSTDLTAMVSEGTIPQPDNDQEIFVSPQQLNLVKSV